VKRFAACCAEGLRPFVAGRQLLDSYEPSLRLVNGKAEGGVKKSLENQNSLTQRRKVAKQTKEFLLSDLSALAPLRDGFSFFHSF